MLENATTNRRNRVLAVSVSAAVGAVFLWLGLVHPAFLFALPIALGIYYCLRRKTVRRLRVIAAPFPEAWEHGLRSHVNFFLALDETQQVRFRNLVKVFLDEVPVTGVRTEVDELCHVLVGASAVIPIFAMPDWEYTRLGEVLIYPASFDDEFNADGAANQNTLGMVGVNHLSGVMILSKPALIAGFANATDKRNVGIHEFAHLVDLGDGAIDGLPAGIPGNVVLPWMEWVGGELKRPADGTDHIDDYAFTNEAEYFAVLSEYFFEAPEVLAKRAPETYEMLQAMYRQNTRSLFARTFARRPSRVGRNATCPCGSGQKYKRCCRRKRKQGLPSGR